MNKQTSTGVGREGFLQQRRTTPPVVRLRQARPSIRITALQSRLLGLLPRRGGRRVPPFQSLDIASNLLRRETTQLCATTPVLLLPLAFSFQMSTLLLTLVVEVVVWLELAFVRVPFSVGDPVPMNRVQLEISARSALPVS
jgi:hypothetical protein